MYKLAKSDNLWKRRIAIVSTYPLIKSGQFKQTIELADIFINDKHDLMHKATGWMLREVGKKDIQTLQVFLQKNAYRMPRVMLRYSIEKMDNDKKREYMKMRA